jgi:small ligand-binding sensory domain FIST
MIGRTQPMIWASALSTRASLEGAVKEVTDLAQGSVLTNRPIWGWCLFRRRLPANSVGYCPCCKTICRVPALVGCSGGGVIGRYT